MLNLIFHRVMAGMDGPAFARLPEDWKRPAGATSSSTGIRATATRTAFGLFLAALVELLWAHRPREKHLSAQWNDGRRFEGSVAVVTGGGGTLGGAVARGFGSEGASRWHGRCSRAAALQSSTSRAPTGTGSIPRT